MKQAVTLAFLLVIANTIWAQDVILARNDWTVVTKSDFDAEIARIPKDQQFAYLASAERVARTVEGILISKTLAAQARAAKLDENPSFKSEIALTVDKILARYRTEQAESQLKEPDFGKRAEEIYRANPRKYAEKDIAHTMHVLVDTKCRTPEAAKARSLEARQELIDGKPFADVAKKYSDDPTVAKNSGDIGPMVVDSLSPAFAEAVKAMKAGEVSEPVLTNFGYHIIKLESLKKGRVYAFNEVREAIIAEVREEWLKQQRKVFIEKITADPNLKLDLEAIQALKTNINAPTPQPKRPG